MAIERSVKNFIRFYKPANSHHAPLTDYIDQEMDASGIPGAHAAIRADDKYCAYSTYQVSILTDEYGIEHRSGPLNESRMIKFGEVKLSNDIMVPAYPVMMPIMKRYSELFPETLGKYMILCGRNVCAATADDIVYNRATGEKIWPILGPRLPRLEP